MNDKAKMIKIYISNTDLYEDEPLYHFLARMAKEFNMAGATISTVIGTLSVKFPM